MDMEHSMDACNGQMQRSQPTVRLDRDTAYLCEEANPLDGHSAFWVFGHQPHHVREHAPSSQCWVVNLHPDDSYI